MEQSNGFKELNKLFDDITKLPCLSNHKLFIVQGSERLRSIAPAPETKERALSEQARLARRIYEFFSTQGLLSQLSGIAPTELDCVYLACSEEAWQSARKNLDLTLCENPYFASVGA